MRKFLAIKIDCTLNMYIFLVRDLSGAVRDWPPSGGRGKAHRETAAFSIFLLVVRSIPGWSKNEKVRFLFYYYYFFISSQINVR
jgi:hypothetical protein